MKLSDNPVTVMFRAVHAARRKKGLCARCGLAPSTKFWLCKWCRADKNEDQRETYDKNAGILSTKAQAERERRKQFGICINCQNPVAVKVFKAGPRNLIRCKTHTLQHAEDVRNRGKEKSLTAKEHMAALRAQRKTKGECIQCSKPSSKYARCVQCRVKCAAKMKSYRKREPNATQLQPAPEAN